MGFKIGLELMVRCGCKTVVDVPITFQERVAGESKLTMKQNIEYSILVINQTDEAPFMRGLLFNAGFLSAKSVLPFAPDCFILHDVDNIPERQEIGRAHGWTPVTQ